MESTSTPVGGRQAPAGRSVADLHDEIQHRLTAQLERVPRPLRGEADDLYDRLGVLTDDRTAFAHPLIQPLVTFPLWVADSCGVADDVGLVSDLVESSLMGYLYVRVHDDHFDEGRGDSATVVYLADSFLVRHQSLLAQHMPAPRFWALHSRVAQRFAEAMLLERIVLRADAEYGEADFDRVLGRSEPLVLAGALLFDRVDRWDEVDTLLAFVHHVVRAGQIVDDVIDCDRDVALGNHTWVARRLGVADDRSGLRPCSPAAWRR